MGWHEDSVNRSGGHKAGYTGPNGRKHDVINYSDVRRGGAMDHEYGSPPNHDRSKQGNQHRLPAPWPGAAPELHGMAHEGYPKPVHDSPNSPNTGYKHNIHGIGSKPRDRGSRYGNSSDDDDDDEYDSDNESVYSRCGRDHGPKVSNYPKAAHERPINGDNHMTRVNPSVPITTHYESRPFAAAGPPRIKKDDVPDHFRKKSPKHLGAAPVEAPRKGKGHQGIIDSKEARRLYGGMQVPTGGYPKEDSGDDMIDCREAAEKYNGVFVPNKIF